MSQALSGGVLPVSAVLANDPIMLGLRPGEHGSTYGGNPLACAVARAALQVLVEEDMASSALRQGARLLVALESLRAESGGLIESVRGRGLFLAIVVREGEAGADIAWDLCMRFAARGESSCLLFTHRQQ